MADMLSLGRYLSEQVKEYDKSTFYNPPEEDLWGVGSTHIPSTGDLPKGLQSITYFRREVIGRASVTIGSFDIPLVSSATSKSDAKAVTVVASTEWSQTELEAYQFAQSRGMMPGDNIIQTNISDVTLAIYRRLHELALVGFSEIGFYGLLNNPSLPTIDESGVQVLQMTPPDLYDWFQGIVSDFKKVSKVPYQSIVAYVSDDVMKALSRRFDNSTGDSPIQSMRSSDRGVFVGDVVSLAELDSTELVAMGVSAANEGLIILGDFRNNKSVIRRFAAIDRTDPFMKDTGFHFGLTGWSSTTEVIFKVPEKFQYIQHGATAAP